ncbi:restriction endonuclease [Allorhodopirellula solitaria]|uniref:Mrr restriction system protein n=1 Tax=Allorhodopirellula solitaria TaxID=2527987 RepID=A0A5C5WN11_9BACT|nr:restriction endonuclease [Allorhodopirellula solitaria]TWT52000.1 Mrr restriction system protein [Allorhodopirellula solitaria]
MAVPDFQSMFVPFLNAISDGQEHAIKDVANTIADQMELSQEDREEVLPSGSQRRLANRVGWARTHLKHAQLIEYTGRGVMKITPQGQEALAGKPAALTLKDLDQFPEHFSWHHKKAPDKPNSSSDVATDSDTLTPEERIANLTAELNSQLAEELLSQVRSMDPYKFEQLVVDLLFAMGYGGSRAEAANVTKASNDEGIDGIISHDRLGLDMIYIQAKRWQENIGRKEIQAFVGALAGKQASKGVFITTSSFRRTAVEYAEAVTQKVVLIDGERLGALMIEYDIAVSRSQTFTLKKIDTDYFDEV